VAITKPSLPSGPGSGGRIKVSNASVVVVPRVLVRGGSGAPECRSEAMRWSEDGHSVSIAPESKFSTHLLPRLNTISYQTLVRRLYYYGFRKTGGAYHHDFFVRSPPSSIRPATEMSGSPSIPSPLHNSTPQCGPRYKVQTEADKGK
jgi:hypothetical protein